jgi:competence protein CoiA
MSTQFAIDAAGRILHVTEVERGLGCHCICVVCGEPVVAKKGPEREHHFAHDSNKGDCVASYETLLHKFAKRVIREKGGLAVPPYRNQAPTNWFWLMFEKVEEEVRMDSGSIRPDIVGYSEGHPTLVEIAYSSFADAGKVAKLAALNLQAVEIDLHDFTPENFDPDAVSAAVLEEGPRKKWLLEGPPATSLPARSRCPEEVVTIQGIWVSMKDLPFGDLAIKVIAFNPEVNAIIKGIAKQNRGWWNPRYKNWLVPRQFAGFARNAVREAAVR